MRWTGVALAALTLAAAPRQAAAQVSCAVNNRSNCQVGGTTAFGMNLTISTVVRLSFPTATIALPNATGLDFAAGFAAPFLVPLSIRANSGWTVSLSATSALWSATGASPRLNKPQSDLQWGTAVGGPFTNLSGSATAIGTGTATAGQTVSLYLRTRYDWTLDTPGSYSLPLVLTISAP